MIDDWGERVKPALCEIASVVVWCINCCTIAETLSTAHDVTHRYYSIPVEAQVTSLQHVNFYNNYWTETTKFTPYPILSFFLRIKSTLHNMQCTVCIIARVVVVGRPELREPHTRYNIIFGNIISAPPLLKKVRTTLITKCYIFTSLHACTTNNNNIFDHYSLCQQYQNHHNFCFLQALCPLFNFVGHSVLQL